MNVIVTGSCRGLGIDICKTLLNDGYTVIGISRTISDDFKVLLEMYKDKLHHYVFDLSNTAKIKDLCADIIEEYGRPYGLINNAALGTDGILGTMHESDISNVIKVNIEAPILLSKYLSRSMLINRRGRIVNISSIIANTGYNGLSVYAASKSALVGFSKSLAREVGRAGITVNVVAPGFMETSMTADLKGEQLEKIKRRSALKNLADSKHVAQTIAFLLSDSGDSITGATFTIDAGSTA
jgi:3-oxoacyl-[acyl-carrier protein] reductase